MGIRPKKVSTMWEYHVVFDHYWLRILVRYLSRFYFTSKSLTKSLPLQTSWAFTHHKLEIMLSTTILILFASMIASANSIPVGNAVAGAISPGSDSSKHPERILVWCDNLLLLHQSTKFVLIYWFQTFFHQTVLQDSKGISIKLIMQSLVICAKMVTLLLAVSYTGNIHYNHLVVSALRVLILV